jgi:hypothetical protein
VARDFLHPILTLREGPRSQGVQELFAHPILCPWFCPAKRWSNPISPLTLESIWLWCWQGKGSLGQWIERTKSLRSSFCLRQRFGNRNSRMESKPSRERWTCHTDRPSALLPSQVFPFHFSVIDWFFHFTPPRGFNWNEKYATRKRGMK